MGSVEKGLQPLRGRPLVEHVIERLAPQVRRIVVSANERRADYERLGYPVVPDVGGRDGPLSGIAAGLAACDSTFLVCVPCDAPFLPCDLVGRLFDPLRDPDTMLAIATTPSGLHPVFCLMRTVVAPRLRRFIDEGGRSVQAWAASLHAATVEFDDEPAFRNLNTVAELRDAERQPND